MDSAKALRVAHVNLAKGFRGGERQTEVLIRHLAALGLEQDLVCRADSPLRVHLHDVPNLHCVTANHQMQGHGTLAKTVDILHAHEAKAVHWAWVHSLWRKTPYILTRRVTHAVANTMFNRACYHRAARAVAISSVIAAALHRQNWTPVIQIPSVFSQQKPDPAQTAAIRGRYVGKFLIGHAGALVDAHKGQREIIAAARRLQTEIPEAHFLMLGRGPEEAALRAESRDLSNMDWLGFQENVADWLTALDVFVFPSRYEGMGSVLLDAMALGIPVAASQVDGIPDIVRHEETGLLFPPNNSTALAKAIIRLHASASLRAELTQGAMAALKKFNPETQAQGYLAVYEDVLREKRKGEHRA